MEIKPQELRIGNLVYAPALKAIRVIDPLDIRDLHEGRLYQPFQAIELTPEWLERFGFDNSFLKLKTFYQGQKTLTLKVTVNMTVAALLVEHIDGKFSEYIPFPIKHVHQLQNLYFALTGEELAIDKTSLI